VEELRAAMAELLTSPSKRCGMIEAGRANAQRFTWRECARRSLGFFEAVAGAA
jgi:glycosyltransferase involved in cell wall biosynthesis